MIKLGKFSIRVCVQVISVSYGFIRGMIMTTGFHVKFVNLVTLAGLVSDWLDEQVQ